jgi:hypothetical protein
MSEANTPSPTSGLPNSQEKSDWGEVSLPLQQAAPSSEPSVHEDVWEDWQTIDFPNAISIDAIPHRAAVESIESTVAENALSELPAELPPVEELITLIQDLNQCNTLLIDRVSQLETDLEQRQAALQAEIQRNQDAPVVRQELGVAQEQIVQLLNQLEFAYQSGQRQQILVETLTEQLESSQERVAQIERECALAQQRYGEQTQQLIESETACRDLRTRLQRQQRHTLQFKAALEKCLDVPPPSYEALTTDPNPLPELVAIPEETAPLLTPKVARIQPWSSQPQFLAADLGSEVEHDRLTRLSTLATESQTVSDPPKLELLVSQVELELPSSQVLEPALETIDFVDKQPVIGLVKDQVEINQVDQSQVDQNQTYQVAAQLLADFPVEAIELGTTLPLNENENVILTTAESESEDALWQNLAQMIEASTDEVATGTTKNLTISEAKRFSAQSSEAEYASLLQEESIPESVKLPISALEQTPPLEQTPLAPAIAEEIAKRINTTPQANPAPRLQSNWPSPVVYPLRSTRKLRSLAAVDLPTFPK